MDNKAELIAKEIAATIHCLVEWLDKQPEGFEFGRDQLLNALPTCDITTLAVTVGCLVGQGKLTKLYRLQDKETKSLLPENYPSLADAMTGYHANWIDSDMLDIVPFFKKGKRDEGV